MLKRNYSGVFCLVLIAATACPAWSQGAPIGPPPSAGGYYSPSQPTPPQPVGQAQPGWQPPAPAYPSSQGTPPYPPAQGAPAPQDGQTYPSYPYPQHHNPYYGGTPHPNFLSQWIDYMFGLPHAIVGSVADFMDRRIFPASPAAQGSQGSAPAPQALTPPSPQAPLPPASVYQESTR